MIDSNASSSTPIDDIPTPAEIVVPPPGYIEVNVKDSVTSNGISSAYVSVIDQSSGLIIDTGYTDSSGFYKVTGLEIGWYTIKVTKGGYHAQSKVINWNGDDDYLTFYLDINVAPSVDAGDDQTVNGGEEAQFDGSGSYDTDDGESSLSPGSGRHSF